MRDTKARRALLWLPSTQGLLPSQKEQLQSPPSSVTWFQRQRSRRNCHDNNNCTTPDGPCGYSHPRQASLSVAQALWQLHSQGTGVHLRDVLKRRREVGWKKKQTRPTSYLKWICPPTPPQMFLGCRIVPECCLYGTKKAKKTPKKPKHCSNEGSASLNYLPKKWKGISTAIKIQNQESRSSSISNWWHQSKQQGSPISFTATVCF